MKNVMVESRFDVRGGLNAQTSPNLLNTNEVYLAENVRLSSVDGAAERRGGSTRLTPSPLGGPVTGLRQWDAPGGKQVVAVAGGSFHYRTGFSGSFTSITPSPAMGSSPAQMETARQNAENAPLRLYVADGLRVRRWTGSGSLVNLSGSSGIPSNVDVMANYGVRMFWHSTGYPQSLYWGVLGDPEDGTAGLGDQGGAGLVDVRRGEGIVALHPVGSSLLIATPNSIARFSGYSAGDIQIAQDTQGISNEIGAVGPKALVGTEDIATIAAERDVYALSESELRPIGRKVKRIYQGIDRGALGEVALGYHPVKRELYVAYREVGASTQKTVLAYSTELDTWYGPFRYPFGIECFALYENAQGDKEMMVGCSDGHVRILDRGEADDMGSGQEKAIGGLLQPADLFFEAGPHTLKTFRRLSVQHEMAEDTYVEVGLQADEGPWQKRPVQGEGSLKDRRLDFYAQGKRFRVRFRFFGKGKARIHGFTAQAFNMVREV